MTDVSHHQLFQGVIEIGGKKLRDKYGKVEWSTSKYQKVVLNYLRVINGKEVGRAIIGLLKKKIIIVPDPNTLAANSAATYPHNGDYDSLYQTPSEEDSDFMNAKNRAYGLAVGGAHAIIKFTPGKYDLDSRINVQEFGLFEIDDALLHEIVHAVRYTHGKARAAGAANARAFFPFKNNEEFMSIMMTNIYRSSKGVGLEKLRWKYSFEAQKENPNIPATRDPDYWTYRGMTLEKANNQAPNFVLTSATFFQKYKGVLLANYQVMPEIFQVLKNVNCTFNPCPAVIQAARGPK